MQNASSASRLSPFLTILNPIASKKTSFALARTHQPFWADFCWPLLSVHDSKVQPDLAAGFHPSLVNSSHARVQNISASSPPYQLTPRRKLNQANESHS